MKAALLAALVLAVALVAVLARVATPPDHTPTQVVVVPRLRSALIKFRSRDPFAARVELHSRKSGPLTTAGPSTADHELEVKRLEPGTEYEYRVITPAQGPSLARRFTTLAASVFDVRLERHADHADLAFSTNLPVRALLTYWPTGENREGAVLTRDATTTGGTAHAFRVDQLDPDRAYELALSFVTADGETVEWPALVAPSARQILEDLVAAVKRVASTRLVARIGEAQRELDRRWPLTGGRHPELIRARTAQLLKWLGDELKELKSSIAHCRPMAATLLGSKRIYLSEKVKVYEFFALAAEIQQFLRAQDFAYDLGIDGVDRAAFRAGTGQAFAGEIIPPAQKPHLKIAPPLEGLLLDANFIDRPARFATTFAVKGPLKRAQLLVELTALARDCKLTATINGKVSLVLLANKPPVEGYPTFLYHELPPELLIEGTNAVELLYGHVVGCLCTSSPRLDRLELSVLR